MFGFNNGDSIFDFEDIANPLNPWERDQLGSPMMRSRQLQSPSEIDLPLEAKEAIMLNATSISSINDFNLRTEGKVTFKGGGDLDGLPLDLRDDTHIYARRGFDFSNTPILPVQRDSLGNPLLDANGRQILVDDAVVVSAGFSASANNNPYSNLIPPTVIPAENVIVPGYGEVRSQELAARIPVGTPTVTFNPQQNPINNANQWNANFPLGGTSTVPTVVRIASGNLNIPANVQLNNYAIIVENGNIDFNGGNHLLNNVVLVANNGNINLRGGQNNTNIAVLASGNININSSSRFTGKTLVANSNGSISFNGSTNADGANDALRVISQGSIAFNGAANLRGELLSVGTFTSNGRFDLFGSVGAKQDITFNGRATITDTNTGVAIGIAASLIDDTAPNNTTNTDKITFDPSVKGTVTGGSITEFKAGFDSVAVANYVNILPSLTNGAFTLSRTEIDRIAGGTLSNGAHTLNLLAKDSSGSQTVIAFTFTLDNLAPSVTLDLAADSDTPPVGDLRTTNSTVTLVGQTEAGASVQLLPSSVATTPNNTGAFQFDNVGLENGANSLTVEATDIAGNVGTFSQTITRDIGNTLGQALNLSVKPGGYLEVPLTGVDANGNRVTYRLQATGKLPTGELDGNGNLIFTPTPAEIGTYQFGLIASNDTQEIPQTVTLRVVADPITTTRISGVIANTAKQPLAGVVVELGGLQATTAADGSFEISANGALPSDTLKVRGEGLSGAETYPFIAEKLPLLLGREVFNGVDNIIGRPIYLPPLDMANAQTINPSVDATVTTAAIPNASVFVKAGTLKDQSGNDFTGELGITEVPSAVTPAALPKNLIPDLVVTIQPGEMVFLQPAPLSLPNRAGYEAGSEMDLWSINPTTGDFDNVGRGRVSADGSTIETIEGGIRNSSWHFFAPQPLTPVPPDRNPNNPDDQCDECETTVPGASEIEMHSGAVRETHDLLSYQSLGEMRGLSLNYNSMRADPRPIVHVAYSGGTLNTNQQLVAKVSVNRGGFTYQVPGVQRGGFGLSGGENFWRITNNFNSTFDVALQTDMREMSSGRYEYTVTSGALQFNNNAFAGATSNQKGEILLVNSSKSAFGSGWGLSGVQELVRNDDGSVLLIDGDGTDMLFRAPISGNKYVSPPGDFSTLERLGDGTFRRTLKDRTVYQFDANNRLVSVKDRHGNETRHTYNAQGQLTQVTDPVGLATTLTYANNRVTSITDPAGRVTQMEYNSSGDLTKITDPDGTSRTWSYDDKHHMTVEIDKRGGREEDVYDFAGRAVSATRTDGKVVRVNPLQTQGLLQPNQTLNPNSAPTAVQFQNGVGSYTDSRGNQETYTLDQRGQVVSARDAVGNLPTTNRNVSTNLVTDTTDARGYTTTYNYDAQGNVVSMTGGDQSQRRYSFDSTFNQVTSETDELGRQTLYDIDPLTGDVRGMTQVVGAVGGDDDLVTRYTYTAQGLVDIVTDPLGRLTDYDYDAQGRQSKVTVAKGTTDEASQQMVYDLVGNPIATIDENGNRIEYEYDALNRVVKTTVAVGTPVQATQQVEYDAAGNQIATIDENGKRTEYQYDAMGQLVKTTTPDPDDGGPLSASVTTSVYDAAGNQTATVDALGRLTEYRYDARNRLTETIHPDGSRETLGYDLGDNNTESTDAKGRKTTRVYDTRGRLTRTIAPLGGSTQFEYDINNQLIAQIDPNGNRTTYTYDQLGRQVSVRDALGNSSSTQFDKIGNTIAETDELNRRTVFTYDNRDREIAVTTPLGLVNRTVYDKVGNVVQAIDPLNRVTRFTFDPRNRQVEVFDPLNQKVTTAYDAIGNVTSTTDELGNTTRFAYDGLNRQIEVIDALNGSVKTDYDAMDNVISVTNPLGKVTRYGYDSRNRRTTVTDALGGVTTTTYDAVGNVSSIIDPTIPAPPPQAPQTTRLVSVGINDEPVNRDSFRPSISSNGRFVAFESNSGNLIPDDINGTDIFVRDLQTDITTLVNVDSNGVQAFGASRNPSISSDGRFVAFDSFASNLVPDDTNNQGDIFVRDLQTGITTLVSVASDGTQANLGPPANSVSLALKISSDGRFVAFDSFASNLVPGDTNNQSDIFVRDLQAGTTTRVNISSDGNQANGGSFGRTTSLSISSNGRFVAFDSRASNLVPNDTNGQYDVFVRDLQEGTIKRISVDSNGNQANFNSTYPSISSDGRFVAFSSGASNLVPGDVGNEADVFVRDLQAGTTTPVSLGNTGNQGNDSSLESSISNDGRFVAFQSYATNLVPDDTNGQSDTFIRDLQEGTTTRVSVDSDGNQIDGSYDTNISGDGRFVTFGAIKNSSFFKSDNIFVVGPISTTSAIPPSVKFRYDANDRLITETNALGATRTFTYDAAGNRTSLTDRNGKTRRFSYDPLNRLTTETWTGDGRTINSTYDAAGQLTQINEAGAAYNYGYDPDGRLLSVNNAGTAGSPSVLMNYGYDAAGNMLSAADSINGTPSGTNTYTFDPLNRVTRMQQSGTGVTNKRVEYAYNAVGQPINVKRFSDLAGTQPVVETTHTFDRLNRLTTINHSKGGTPLASYNYSFDANSRITSVTNKDGTSTNTYDDTDQLTGVDYSFQPDEAYTYDANGNRTNPGYVTGANNRLLSDGKFNYDYDGEGNRIKQTDILTGAVTEYAWDYRNRLTQITEKNAAGTVINQSNQTYDPNNLRIGKTANGTTERYVYGQNQNIALEFDGSGALTNRYLHGNNIDEILADESNGSTLWTFTDHQNSVRDLADSSGNVRNHLVYDAFGGLTSQTNSSVTTQFGYTGREFEPATGLQYNRGRFYAPFTGKFISPDPIGFAAGDANLYRYVRNSPVGAIDPLGLWGKVVSQRRSLAYTSTGSASDAEQLGIYPNGFPYIGLGIPVQVYYPPLSSPNRSRFTPIFDVDASPSIDSTDRVILDVTDAKIEYTDTEPSQGSTLEPWGGRYVTRRPADDNGHIVPRELGGERRIYNFFSQNQSINRGGYRDFGSYVNSYLTTLHKKCSPNEIASVELTIELKHTGEGRISGFPLRPDRVETIASFSDGKKITGWFSNVHGVRSDIGVSFYYN